MHVILIVWNAWQRALFYIFHILQKHILGNFFLLTSMYISLLLSLCNHDFYYLEVLYMFVKGGIYQTNIFSLSDAF